eukprot:1355352-Amorphochlora_amoeboformis.AAC.1
MDIYGNILNPNPNPNPNLERNPKLNPNPNLNRNPNPNLNPNPNPNPNYISCYSCLGQLRTLYLSRSSLSSWGVFSQ